MNEPTINYDEVSDTLYISFALGEKGTGIELNEHLLLRVNKQEKRAIGLTIFEYSVLAQRTDLGLRNVPLTGLENLSEETRQMVLAVLQREPVNRFLRLSAYTPSVTELIPITSVEPLPVLA
ncbi:MAG: DUF2283 domain-containing protein [Chloroflexi bacterium]|nr:DUF2283 domain-containing protein [Ardenticatenaceae bacterium]MBL1131367.1 DUF2283 domain-containing protein [Chloroflexota bacterium]NOG37470.1 DUF2283 domain-containing protein [Chloroflexota bacterium]